MTVSKPLPRVGEAEPPTGTPERMAEPGHGTSAGRVPAVIVVVVIATAVGLSRPDHWTDRAPRRNG